MSQACCSTAPDPRDTARSAAWPPGADVVSVRFTPAYMLPGELLPPAIIDLEHRLRRLIRRINSEARR